MEEKNRIGFHSFVSTGLFVASFLLVGVPLWWKTTEVYRYPLPYAECQGLLREKVRHSIPVQLTLEDSSVSQGQLWEELLDIREKEDSAPSITFHWSMSACTPQEQSIVGRSHSITDLDDILNSREASEEFGRLEIFVLRQNYSSGPKFTIGKGRVGYIRNTGNSVHLAQDIHLLAQKMAQVERLQRLFTPSHGRDKTPDKDRMRYLRSSKNFGLTFSLIVPEPQVLQVHWDIQRAVAAYLNQVLEELKIISTVKVKSQVLYMTSLPFPTEAEGGEFVVNPEHLPLINSIEAKLGSDTSVHPNLNFVLYIPTRDQTPLRIRDSEGAVDAFLLPQWGGFLIHNCPPNASQPVSLEARHFMRVFLAQFRLLLGLPERNDLESDNFQLLPGAVINKWEVDFLVRRQAQEQLSASASSLSSLSQLLHTIGNIVINEHVGQKIHFALSSTQESLRLLEEGNLLEGFQKAQHAFLASDEAFFDPSLLALLYFPEDQKYAIYIPLFLPISIPVLTSVAHLWHYWKQRTHPE